LLVFNLLGNMQLIIKRICDTAIAVSAIICLSPILLITAFCIRITMGNPILFRQPRAGYKCKAFRVYKFRSMTNERDQEGRLLPNIDRLTIVGKFIRATSIDELPQFINVIRGEMSLIGPRPLPIVYLERYNYRQALRQTMRPGISGLAQATYRGQSRSWEERLELDSWYVENWSLWLDLKILITTFYSLLIRIFNRKNREKNSSQEFLGTPRN
jgi:lipopolysaccharide/colanic/teichoic acid biosynthesis glycosyltransferase